MDYSVPIFMELCFRILVELSFFLQLHLDVKSFVCLQFCDTVGSFLLDTE